jgi:hypothetical protein
MAFVTDLGATSCLADALDANAVLSVVQDSRPDLIVDLCTELRGGVPLCGSSSCEGIFGVIK